MIHNKIQLNFIITDCLLFNNANNFISIIKLLLILKAELIDISDLLWAISHKINSDKAILIVQQCREMILLCTVLMVPFVQ